MDCVEHLLSTWVASDCSGVRRGRPAPDMIEAVMREINTYSSSFVECMRDEGAAQEEIGKFVNKRRIRNYRQALAVGDTKADLEAADNCGMPSALVLSGSVQTEEGVRAINQELGREHIIYPSLVEIAQDIESEIIADKIRWLNTGISQDRW